MEQRVNPEQLMLQYLLGDLSMEEQLEVEAEYFADPEKFDQLRAVELDLIEGYVNGKISKADRAKFERHYLNSPARREQVRFFKTLNSAVTYETTQQLRDKAPVRLADLESVDLGQRTSWWQSLLAFFRGPQLALGTAILILMAGGIWQMVELSRLSQRVIPIEDVATTQQDGRDSKQQTAVPPEQNDGANQQPGSPQQPQQPQASAPAVVSFAWTIDGFRDPSLKGAVVRKLRIPRDTDSVRLTFNLPSSRYIHYTVALQNLDGEDIWRRGGVKAGRVKSGSSVNISVPAKQFRYGTYSLVLNGKNETGEVQKLGVFYIEVNR